MKTEKSEAEGGHLRSRIGHQLLVRDVMTGNVISISKYETVVHVANILAEKNISGLPVVDEAGHLVGIITESDIFRLVANEWSKT